MSTHVAIRIFPTGMLSALSEALPTISMAMLKQPTIDLEESLAPSAFNFPSTVLVSSILFRPKSSKAQVYIYTPNGRRVAFAITSSETVQGLKEKIGAKEGIVNPLEMILLSHGGKMMHEQDRALSDYGVQAGSCIHVTLSN